MANEMENMRLTSVRRRESTQTEYVYERSPTADVGRAISSMASNGLRAGAWVAFEVLLHAPGVIGEVFAWTTQRCGYLMFCGVGGVAWTLRELGSRTLKLQAEYIRHRRPEMPAQWILKAAAQRQALTAGDNVKRLRADNEED
jgi:hypothetical protein